MAYWEFLLQKEGDRDWLPLETAHVEISEGRYRIIAHTSFRETAVEIQLSQRLPGAVTPRSKTLKRLGLTSDSGLMAVIPFTHLTPGAWVLTCAAIVADAPAVEYGVQLQVLEIESGVGYWDAELDPPDFSDPPPRTTLEPVAAMPAVLVPRGSVSAASEGAGVTGHPVDPATLQFALETLTITAVEDFPLRLQLQHQALVAQPQARLYLQGQATSFSTVEGLPTEGTFLWQLRDPETGTVVYQAARSHSLSTLPSRFILPLSLPTGLSTRLLVGELSLWTAADPAQILAIQGFSVTLNLDTLLELVANRAEAAAADVFTPMPNGDPTVPDGEAPETEAAPLLSPLSPRQIPFRLVYLPASGLTLPPLIYRPIDQPRVAAPSLPPLDGRRSRPAPPSPEADPPPARPTQPLTLPPLGSARPLATDALRHLGEGDRPDPSAPSLQTAQSPEAITAALASGFQPDVSGRFWERLSALAETAQKAAADQKAQIEAAGVETAAASMSPEIPWLTFPDSEASDTQPNYEVVIYEPDAPESETAIATPTESEQRQVDVLLPEEGNWDALGSVPVPMLILPEGELIAGTPLPISVRLPQYPRRLTVKVWVTDVQSRTLVDRPRWLMNWTPTDTGEQTAFLQLQVPMGCLESKFEAIAIDLATQQESYKVSQVRGISPPNLPPAIISPL